MTKYKLLYRKKECIGAGACEAAFPEAWFFDQETSIATLKSPSAKKTAEFEELIFEAEDLEKHLEAAQVCPVQIIEIIELATGKKIYPRS